MKIYTKTGDDGTTGLIGGQRTKKSDLRIDCYGTVDELNAAIGLAATVSGQAVGEMLRKVQNELFNIGSHLAAPDEPGEVWKQLPPLEQAMTERLESEIDAAQSKLTPLRQFILPGGSEAAARLHLARTVCRRAERLLVELAQNRPAPAIVGTYLNRLSDWLFVYARLANHELGVADVPWKK